MSIHYLPAELLCSVFQQVNPHDTPRLRHVCQMFNNVIQSNYIFLPRVAYLVKIYCVNGHFMIANMKSGDIVGSTQNLFEFDFNNWKKIGIVELEFSDIQNKNSQQLATVFGLILNQLAKTRQSQLRKMTFKNVDLSAEFNLNELFQMAIDQCESIVVENSSLPINIAAENWNSAKFDCFRWISSSSIAKIPSDAILHKIRNDMKSAVNKRSFTAEMDSVSVEAACDFLEEWLGLPIASFFNLSFHNCDDTWKTRFLAECMRRQLTHNYMEFQSRTHNNAHAKVSFSQDASTCCIWPILDVPARTTGQSVCYARYFRDF